MARRGISSNHPSIRLAVAKGMIDAREFRLRDSYRLEKDFQDDMIKFMHLHGWAVAHFRPACSRDGKRWFTAVAADGEGFLDLIGLRERTIFVELKADDGDLSDRQRLWLEWHKRARNEAYVWWPKDREQIERVIGGAA